MAPPRARAVAFSLLFFYAFASAASLQSNLPTLSDTSSSDPVSLTILNISTNSNEYGDCIDPATRRRDLYIAKEHDCVNAAWELLFFRDPSRSMMFSRKRRAGFRLPIVVRNGTCVISIDVMNDEDEDIMKPYSVYAKALDLVHRCTTGNFPFGGRTTTGPKMVVDILVYGRIWPIKAGVDEPTALNSAVVVAREPLASVDPSSLNETSPKLTKSLVANTKSLAKGLDLDAPGVGGAPECNDPPLPRERAWPINFKDCELATEKILGNRERSQRYTFSRGPVATKFHFPLPATFNQKSCVVLLDMNNDWDEDTVRLSIVEATAYVLAHKCSGKEKSVDQYGGRATVGTGAKNLINVWVYGRPWPPPVGASNATNLVLAHPAPLISSE